MSVLKKFWKIVIAVVGIFFVTYAIANSCANQEAQADTNQVVVDPAVPNHDALKARIERKVTGADEISVWISPGDDHDQLQASIKGLNPGKILILAYGPDVYVRGNDWVPQVEADEMLDRVRNVNQALGDQVVGLVVAIHQYQTAHQPPPPPPPPPGPPPPPPGPSVWDFHWWNWAWGWLPVTIAILFPIWLPLHLRYRRRINKLAHDADEQADWGFDQYGIKTSIE